MDSVVLAAHRGDTIDANDVYFISMTPATSYTEEAWVRGGYSHLMRLTRNIGPDVSAMDFATPMLGGKDRIGKCITAVCSVND